jgi:hypothetical protein
LFQVWRADYNLRLSVGRKKAAVIARLQNSCLNIDRLAKTHAHSPRFSASLPARTLLLDACKFAVSAKANCQIRLTFHTGICRKPLVTPLNRLFYQPVTAAQRCGF